MTIADGRKVNMNVKNLFEVSCKDPRPLISVDKRMLHVKCALLFFNILQEHNISRELNFSDKNKDLENSLIHNVQV